LILLEKKQILDARNIRTFVVSLKFLREYQERCVSSNVALYATSAEMELGRNHWKQDGLLSRLMPSQTDKQYWFAATMIMLLAVLFSGSPIRTIPGGPYVSFSHNILPCILAVASVGVVLWRSIQAWSSNRLVFVILSLIALAVVSFALVDVYSFSIRPHSRGALLGY
jgi:hypothetical protein